MPGPSAPSSLPSGVPPPGYVRLDRHTALAPLLANLNGWYGTATNGRDDRLSPGQMYADLRDAWWPLARAKYVEGQPQVECRVWADFFCRYINTGTLSLLCHAIFDRQHAAVQADHNLRSRFTRVATLLDKDPFVLFVVLGEDVTTKSNSLKMLSRVLAPTQTHPPLVDPKTLLGLLNEEMLKRHRDSLESYPALTSIDVTTVCNRYLRPPPSRQSSVASSPAPQKSTKRRLPASSSASAAVPEPPAKRRRCLPVYPPPSAATSHLVTSKQPGPSHSATSPSPGSSMLGEVGRSDGPIVRTRLSLDSGMLEDTPGGLGLQGLEDEDENLNDKYGEDGGGEEGERQGRGKGNGKGKGREGEQIEGGGEEENWDEEEARARIETLRTVLALVPPAEEVVGLQTYRTYSAFQQLALVLVEAEEELL